VKFLFEWVRQLISWFRLFLLPYFEFLNVFGKDVMSLFVLYNQLVKF